MFCILFHSSHHCSSSAGSHVRVPNPSHRGNWGTPPVPCGWAPPPPPSRPPSRPRPPAATTGCNHPPPPPVITGAHVRKFSVELHAGASHVLRPPSLRIARRSPSSSSLSVSVRPRFRWNRRDSKHAAAPPSRPAATARDRPTPPDIQMKPWGTRRGRLRPPLPVSFSCLCSPSLLLLASPLFQILLPFPNSPAPPPPSCAPYACWSSLTRMLRPSSSESWYAWMAASARSAVA